MSTISILGVEINIAADEAGMLDYIHAFMDAYEDVPSDIQPDKHIHINVKRGDLLTPARHSVVSVHRSKHAYWTFDAELYENHSRNVIWRTKGVSVRLRDAATNVEVTVGPTVDPRYAGEALFHICRSLALYHRSGYRGNLLHASAVSINNSAVLFMGKVFAGKSTLLAESVFKHGAKPLANDRVLILAGVPPIAVSWPSYSSFCEGTLLNYPALAAAAEHYENGNYPFRTQTWSRPLARLFKPDAKRIYPMLWFSQAAGVKFVRQEELRMLVLAQVEPEPATPGIRRLDLANPADRTHLTSILDACTFDDHEPSFLPWHGLRWPAGAPALQDLIDRLAQARVGVFDFRVSVRDLGLLKQLFSELK